MTMKNIVQNPALGKVIMAGGHHGAAAMQRLGEKTIPTVVRQWSSLSKAVQQRLLNSPNGKALSNYLK